MSSLEAMSKQVRQPVVKIDGADTISESDLGETLRQEARAAIDFKLALFQDESLTPTRLWIGQGRTPRR